MGGGAATVQGAGKEMQGRMKIARDAYLALRVTGQASLPAQICPHSTLWWTCCPFMRRFPNQEPLRSGSLGLGGFLPVWGYTEHWRTFDYGFC